MSRRIYPQFDVLCSIKEKKPKKTCAAMRDSGKRNSSNPCFPRFQPASRPASRTTTRKSFSKFPNRQNFLLQENKKNKTKFDFLLQYGVYGVRGTYTYKQSKIIKKSKTSKKGDGIPEIWCEWSSKQSTQSGAHISNRTRKKNHMAKSKTQKAKL